mgnify:CR=1 FL=1
MAGDIVGTWVSIVALAAAQETEEPAVEEPAAAQGQRPGEATEQAVEAAGSELGADGVRILGVGASEPGVEREVSPRQ